MRRLLFDLFGLFMKAQNESGMAGIHEAARIRELGIDPHEFDLAYRELRDPLDANTQDFEQYMAAMGERLGADFCAIPGLVEATEQADVDSWSAHHPDMVAWLEHMHRDGQAPAVLSNIPRTHLGWVRENKPWITLFEPAFFMRPGPSQTRPRHLPPRDQPPRWNRPRYSVLRRYVRERRRRP